MQPYLLSLLLFTPLIGALLIMFLPKKSSKLFRRIVASVNIIQLGFLLYIISLYETEGGIQFIERQTWFEFSMGNWGALKAEYFIGIDGLSLPLIGLSVIILSITTISSWNIERSQKGYFSLLLVLNTAIIGSFVALDFLLFYLFFEFMLLPMFFLIGIWGGLKREYASIKFFLYTLLGSIFILIVLVGLYLSVHDPGSMGGSITHTFNLLSMRDSTNFISNSIFDPNNPWEIAGLTAREWGFILLFIGFAIKLPMVPLHTWLPDAHVEAPTPVSVILAAILLKIGAYGLLRIAYPIFPEAALQASSWVAMFGVISILYGALAAMASMDLKRLIAYSSVSHMGFVLLGLASMTSEGLSGVVYQMVSHGILSALLFIIAGILYDRTRDRIISNYSGLASKVPYYFTIVLITFFASLGLPGFSGFIAELMVLLGAFKSNGVNGLIHEGFAVGGAIGLIFGAAYFLWTIQRMFFGTFHLKGKTEVTLLTDVNTREILMTIPLIALALYLGLLPQRLIDVINPFAGDFVQQVIQSAKAIMSIP